MDVKYLKDVNTKHYVALSVVDAGAGFHAGTILKKRKPKHMWKKYVQTYKKQITKLWLVLKHDMKPMERKEVNMFTAVY